MNDLPDAAAAAGEDESAADDSIEKRSAVVDAALHGERLDRVLVTLAGEFSRSHLQHLIDLGHVQVDGQRAATASRRVRVGQRIELELVPTDESRAFRAQPMALAVLYEDEHLLVLDKPAGLVVHPAPGNWSGTLLNGLLAHHAAAATLPRGGIVHRLDKDTSGVMMVGKSLPAVTALVRDIAARDVHRRYLALAHGTVASQRVDAPIGRDPAVRVRMAVVASGKPARTDVECLATQEGISAVRCILHTGRTHQIRVHLASRGHPLVADAVYGGRAALGLVRQALHAVRLELAHPVTREPLVFQCAPPPDFSAAWRVIAGVTIPFE
ncbi:RluA family pseudouridine synthase [Rubrivivax gelatinosus]|uniref:Pseudouridine synthase n=1 Tax=Rubrivivax gelatinosus TaxID=28068 RepID=A0ABS1DYH5_RUBGE|nr:RluA family pseudouridine synthase [Rubrivivax gelatinosus]